MSTLKVNTIQDAAGAFEHARLVQMVSTSTGASSTTTTPIPEDDTIPQNDEGAELLTLAITPKDADNKLFIHCMTLQRPSTGRDHCIALFQDTTANALACQYVANQDAQETQQVLTHVMTAGTTSSTTFKMRGGADSAATVTFNGGGSGRLFGGVCSTMLMIMEVRADA
jgi:hypothetical protein